MSELDLGIGEGWGRWSPDSTLRQPFFFFLSFEQDQFQPIRPDATVRVVILERSSRWRLPGGNGGGNLVLETLQPNQPCVL